MSDSVATSTDPSAKPVPPAPPATPSDGMSSVQDLMDRVVQESGLAREEFELLPTGLRFVTPGGKVWEAAQGVPGREEDLVIIGLFLDGEDVRVYCLPKRAQDDAKKILTSGRYVLNRETVNGSPFWEALALETFISEMAEELTDLYEVAGDRLRVTCEKCSTSNESNALYCNECGTKFPEEPEEAG